MKLDLDTLLAGQSKAYEMYRVTLRKLVERYVASSFDAWLVEAGLGDIPVAILDIVASGLVQMRPSAVGDQMVYIPTGADASKDAQNVYRIETPAVRVDTDGLQTGQVNVQNMLAFILGEYIKNIKTLSESKKSPVRLIEMPEVDIQLLGYTLQFQATGHVCLDYVEPEPLKSVTDEDDAALQSLINEVAPKGTEVDSAK